MITQPRARDESRRRVHAASPLLPARCRRQALGQDKPVGTFPPRILRVIDEAANQMNTKAAGGASVCGTIKVRLGYGKRIERTAIILDNNFKLVAVARQVKRNRPAGFRRVTVTHDVAEQLIENNQQAIPLPARNIMPNGKIRREFDELVHSIEIIGERQHFRHVGASEGPSISANIRDTLLTPLVVESDWRLQFSPKKVTSCARARNSASISS